MNFIEFTKAVVGQTFVLKTSDSAERPTPEEIAQLAYQFYEAGGRRDGHALEDWLSAERELKHHYR